MANKKISELTPLSATPAGDDVVPLVDTSASATKSVTVSNLLASKADSSHTHAISDVTSLQTSLDAKQAAPSEGAFANGDKTKLDGIEASATADQTGAEIKAAYEGEADTNAFTDADHTKLDGIEASATADQTGAEIKTAYEGEADTNAFTDADHTKLDAIEASADVTDTTNVTAAGALMDSELTDLAGVKGVTISTLQPKPSEGAFANGDKTKLDGIAASANNYSHPNHSGEVTSTADGATVIAADVVDEANLKVSNSPTDGYSLVARSGETGGLKWESVSGGGGGGSGTVTQVDGAGTVSGLTLTGTVTSSGSLTLGGTLSADLTSDVTGNLPDGNIASASTWNGKQSALTFGIANTNAVKVDSATVADDEYARFTASGLESRSGSEVLSDIGAAASAHAHSAYAEKASSNTWTAAQQGNTHTAAFSALSSGVLDFDTYQNFVITLGAGVNAFTNPTTDSGNTGQTGVIVLIQDSSASTATWTSDYKNVGGSAPTLSSGSAKVDVLPYIIQADNTILLGAPQLDFS